MATSRKFWISITLAFCFIVIATAWMTPGIVKSAFDVSPWLAGTNPTLEKLDNLDPNLPRTPANSSSLDCQQREIITRPQRLLPTPQSKISHTDCVVDTDYGALSKNGWLQRQGSTVSGQLRTAGGSSLKLIPIPRSSSLITLGGGLFAGYHLYFYDNLDAGITSSAIHNGEVSHKLPAEVPQALRDKSGKLLVAAHESISFSPDGEWMVVDLLFIGTARINTKTREVLPFGNVFSYSSGLGPFVSTAASPGGKYAVVASTNSEVFKLYDLSTCGAVPDLITTKVACGSQDLRPFVKQQNEGFSAVMGIRFKNNYTLSLYVNTKTNNITTASHQILTAAGQKAASFDYLALGDSFASGEGAYHYKAITDTNENKCHLSQRSYPYLISSLLGYGQYESIACSGAVVEDISNATSAYVGQVRDKMERGERNPLPIFNNFYPGYLAQYEFPQKYQPKIITLSVAGNDVGFSDKIKRCLDTDTCYSSYEDRLEIVNEVNAQFYRLVDMYTQVKGAGNPQAKIYVIGYPQIAFPEGKCDINVRLNRQELVFAGQLVSYLNSIIKKAAENAGVAYVDIEDAFNGHRLCETDSSKVAVNGLTAGNDMVNLPFIHGPIGNESYHPNTLGHYLFKNTILAKTTNFTQPMPAPNPNITLPEITDSLPFLNAPKSNRLVRNIKNKTGTNGGVIQTGKTWVTNYSNLAPLIKASSTVHGWLNSTPVDLGTFQTDATGNVTVQITLPASVPTGLHTLHLYGKNTSEEDVDIYQTVYVNNGEPIGPCLVVSSSGFDTDKDEIDDACDPFIDKPPLEVIPDLTPLPTIGTTPYTPPTPNPAVQPAPDGTPSPQPSESPESNADVEQTIVQPAGNLDPRTQAILTTTTPNSAHPIALAPTPPQVAGLATSTPSQASQKAQQPKNNQTIDTNKFKNPLIAAASIFAALLTLTIAKITKRSVL